MDMYRLTIVILDVVKPNVNYLVRMTGYPDKEFWSMDEVMEYIKEKTKQYFDLV